MPEFKKRTPEIHPLRFFNTISRAKGWFWKGSLKRYAITDPHFIMLSEEYPKDHITSTVKAVTFLTNLRGDCPQCGGKRIRDLSGNPECFVCTEELENKKDKDAKKIRSFI